MQGLHFVVTKTGGLIASVSTSKSFTLRRLGKLPNGKPRWSGPLFSSASQVGLGLTAGESSFPVTTLSIHGCRPAGDFLRSGAVFLCQVVAGACHTEPSESGHVDESCKQAAVLSSKGVACCEAIQRSISEHCLLSMQWSMQWSMQQLSCPACTMQQAQILCSLPVLRMHAMGYFFTMPGKCRISGCGDHHCPGR